MENLLLMKATKATSHASPLSGFWGRSANAPADTAKTGGRDKGALTSGRAAPANYATSGSYWTRTGWAEIVQRNSSRSD